MSDPLLAEFDSTTPDAAPDDPLSPEDMKMHESWVTLAVTLGYNELAKLGKTLGDKVYFRLLRDQALARYVELGGNDNVFTKDTDAVATIISPQPMPTIIFRERDIELMRDAVYEHDKRMRSTDAQPVKP
jgi:hypothetical protein